MKADGFKVGDTVYCILYGKGKCVAIKKNENYPVVVKMEEKGEFICYSYNGQYSSGQKQVLFFEEIIIPESAYKRPRWRAEKLGSYYTVSAAGEILKYNDVGSTGDNKFFIAKNYFKTVQEAKESKFYKVFHEEE
jgi:hypothetical protein